MGSDVTRERLEAHHGGAQFHDVMVRSFASRFGDAFWSLWSEQITPYHDDTPTYIDMGCGPGLMLEAWRQRFPQASLHGVELQSYMLDTARKVGQRIDASIHEADLHTVRLPLADGTADAVLSTAVIHEMREPVGMLREVRRLLAPTGRLVLMDWVRVPLTQYLGAWDDDPLAADAEPELRANRIDHFMEHNKFSADDLRWLVERCGFVIETALERRSGQFLWIVARPA